MRIGDLIRSCLASLWQRKFRTSLTVLGVIIGTMAVVVMVSLGVGLTQAQLDSIEQFSSLRQVEVYGHAETGEPIQTERYVDDAFLAELAQLPGVENVWPIYYLDVTVTIGGVDSYLQVQGAPNDMIQQLNVEYASGGPPEPGDPLGFIYGDKASENFWDPYTGVPVEVDLMNDQVFVTFGGDPWAEPGAEQPDNVSKKILVPTAAVIAGEPDVWTQYSHMVYADLDALRQAMEKALPGKALPNQPTTPTGKPLPNFVYSMVILQTADVEATEDLTALMREAGYPINSAVEWLDQIRQQSAIIQAVFGGIGFISLLVAAIGIANTMLMSVYERTREIGIMKVLGAALKDIRRMFLLESATIGFLGGLVGVLLSLAVSSVINTFFGGVEMGMAEGTGISQIPLWLMVGAIAFSTAIGTVAGMIPATRAMRLSALGAIRAQ